MKDATEDAALGRSKDVTFAGYRSQVGSTHFMLTLADGNTLKFDNERAALSFAELLAFERGFDVPPLVQKIVTYRMVPQFK